jgi:hypothetical protein
MTDENQFQRVHWDGDEYQASDDDGPDGMPLRPRGAGLSDADVELLTLAARALGAQVEVVDGETWLNLHFADGRVAHSWNSLLFSGDALDLAVQLVQDGYVLGIELFKGGACVLESSESGDDPFAATRRAITRAAAEIAVANAKKQA